MPKVTHPQEEKLRRTIRDAIALDPLITLDSLQNVVERQTNHRIGRPYLIKLKKKIHRETLVEVERSTVNERVRQLRENFRTIIDALKRIAYPSPTDPDKPNVTEKRKALEAIVRTEGMLAKLEMDFGIFERQLGKLEVDHRLKPMPEDAMANAIKAFEVWGMQPEMRKIGPKRVIEIKATEIINEPAKQQSKPASREPQPIPVITGAGLVDAK